VDIGVAIPAIQLGLRIAYWNDYEYIGGTALSKFPALSFGVKVYRDLYIAKNYETAQCVRLVWNRLRLEFVHNLLPFKELGSSGSAKLTIGSTRVC
jgi:hypothetical protein